MQIYFHSNHTNNFVIFDVEINKNGTIESQIDQAANIISKYGEKNEFPEELLNKLTDEEIDSILLMDFCSYSRKYIENCLFIDTEDEKVKFICRDTKKFHISKARGKNRAIIVSRDSEQAMYFAENISIENLSNNYERVVGFN